MVFDRGHERNRRAHGERHGEYHSRGRREADGQWRHSGRREQQAQESAPEAGEVPERAQAGGTRSSGNGKDGQEKSDAIIFYNAVQEPIFGVDKMYENIISHYTYHHHLIILLLHYINNLICDYILLQLH